MSRRALAFLIFAIVVAAGCVRLGFWQLHRLAERRALNAQARRRDCPRRRAPCATLLRDSATAGFRRATATGTYDFANEFALASRTRAGSPGVNIVTPLRVAGTDTAVLVNRGWVYAPDAMTVDFNRWREPERRERHRVPRRRSRAVRAARSPRRRTRASCGASTTIRWPGGCRIRSRRSSSSRRNRPRPPRHPTSRDSTPARLPAPLLDEGPHLGYAIQWFAFAVIGARRARSAFGRSQADATWQSSCTRRRGG